MPNRLKYLPEPSRALKAVKPQSVVINGRCFYMLGMFTILKILGLVY
jgi:hypothetical protein